jgi:uncharacterized damage-inducible protein DinB
MTHLSRLFAHNAWADERALEAMRRAGSDDPRTARALSLLAHLVGAEEVWASRIEGRDSRTAVWPTLGIEECEALARDVHAALRAIAERADLAAEIRYRTSAGAEFASRLDDILLHVALHGSYHRGQVALLLRDAGAEPAPTDYIAWARGAPAATRTDAASPAAPVLPSSPHDRDP